jgi:DNA-binding NarL/FixJ family response regulator
MSEPIRAEGPQRADRRYRLVLADDHPDVREEIRQLLARDFDVLRAVGDGAALLEAVAELKPDAIVSDIQMPRMDGIEAGGTLLSRGLCEAFVVLSMYPDRHLVETALEAGIRVYVLKLDACEELIPAVYAALRGERYLSRGIRDRNSGSSRNY